VKRVAIMQGRLSPPAAGRLQAFPGEAWADELPRAAQVGLDAIEIVVDGHAPEHNPLLNDAQAGRMPALVERHGVALVSACADVFLEDPILRLDDATRAERLELLAAIATRGAAVGLERIVLPLVEENTIDGARDERNAAAWIAAAMDRLAPLGVELHLEIDLPPLALARFVGGLGIEGVAINYDSGNSAALGYRVEDELDAYGPLIGSVHVKDRLRDGPSVPLGEGDADFDALFAGLDALDYPGDIVLQPARGTTGDETAWAARNLAWLQERR
jgi:hexulose-6-phosphate isomerase